MHIIILTTSILTTLLIINGWWISPSVLLVTLCFLTGLAAIIHYVITRSQPYAILAALAILISDTFAAWAYRTWSEHGFGLSPLAMARGAFFLMFVVTMYGVFAYWRAVTAFRIKRGNVERERCLFSSIQTIVPIASGQAFLKYPDTVPAASGHHYRMIRPTAGTLCLKFNIDN